MDHDDESGDLLGWVTDFDNPEVAVPRDKPSASMPERLVARIARSKPQVVPLVAGATGLAAIAAIVITALARPIEEETGTGRPGLDDVLPRPTASAPTATSAPEQPSMIPETCAGLYSADMERELIRAGLEVNSAWTGSRNLPAGSADAELLELLGEGGLGCFWLDGFGGRDAALLTRLTDATDATVQGAMARLTELGLTRREENGGVRYFSESRDAAGELHGESHFFREGLWFATRWYGPGQFGYTADMVEQVFG